MTLASEESIIDAQSFLKSFYYFLKRLLAKLVKKEKISNTKITSHHFRQWI